MMNLAATVLMKIYNKKKENCYLQILLEDN